MGSGIAAQFVGAAVWVVVADVMYRCRPRASTRSRRSGGLWLADVVAFGLPLVIFGVVRSGRSSVAPFPVGAYIGGASFFTSSTSFANPALTVARALSDTFAGIAPASVPAFVTARVGGRRPGGGDDPLLYPDVATPPPWWCPTVTFPLPGRGRLGDPRSCRADIPEVLFVTQLTDEAARTANVVVIMGCGDARPVYRGKRYLDCELAGPAGQGLEAVRPIRDQIDVRVRTLLAELVPGSPTSG